MSIPTFLIVGRSLCGCIALARVLGCHPQIYMSPVEEPSFFALEGAAPHFDGPGDEEWSRKLIYRRSDYQALFTHVTTETAIGEVSTMYTNWYRAEQTAANIYRQIPDTQLVVILRQPAERAYAAFLSRRQQGREPLSNFVQALAAESAPERANWAPACRYFQNGLYYTLLEPYYRRFSPLQIKVGLYEDSQSKPQAFIQDILRFLHVDETVRLAGPLGSEPFRPRVPALQSLLGRPYRFKALFKRLLPPNIRNRIVGGLQALNRGKPAPLDTELRWQLTMRYREEILKLQDLVGRDLAHWLKS